MIDHNSIAENHIAVRYLLDELTDTERDAYEEHYFECTECAEELSCASEFLRVASEEIKRPSRWEKLFDRWGESWAGLVARHPLLRPAHALAFGLLFAGSSVGVYQSMVSGGPQMVASAPATLTESRGPKLEVTASKGKSFSLAFKIPTGDFQSYDVRLLSESGTSKYSAAVLANDVNNPVQIIFPGGELQPGKYTVVVLGVKESKTSESLAEYPFILQFRSQ